MAKDEPYEYTPAPPAVDGVNQGVRLLQRRVYQYNGFASGQAAKEGNYSRYPTKAWRSMQTTGFTGDNRTLNGFFRMNFTPSSDFTVIHVQMQQFIYSPSTADAYNTLSIIRRSGPGGMADYDIPEYSWRFGGWTASYGFPPVQVSYWYNSWGKDQPAEIQWNMTSSGSRVYTKQPNEVNNEQSMLDSPNMVVEEWENGNPNGSGVQFYMHGLIGDGASRTSPGNVFTGTHPADDETGRNYEYKQGEFNDAHNHFPRPEPVPYEYGGGPVTPSDRIAAKKKGG